MTQATDVKASTYPQHARSVILRWGPYPHEAGVFGGGMGGYARYNSQALRSGLASEFDLRPVPMSVPRFHRVALALLHLPLRMVVDVVTISMALFRWRPDVLHITALYWRSIYREAYAVWLARRLGISSLYDIRAGTFTTFIERGTWLERRLGRYVLRRATMVSAEGRPMLRAIREAADVDATFLPSCFLDQDLVAYEPAELHNPPASEPFRLAYMGYVMSAKGVDVLLEAGRRLSEKTPVHVTLLGAVAPAFRGTLDAYMEQQTDRFQVTAVGRLGFDEVLQHLQQQHVFVFLSRFFGEGQPNAVTEAMALGLPIVASRNGFLEDLVSSDSGVLVDDPEDPDRIVEVLEDLRSDWDRLRSLGDGARARIEQRFVASVVLETTAQLYRSCAGTNKPNGRSGQEADERS